MKEIIAALLVAMSLYSSVASNMDTDVNTGYIFLGDSRTVGMNNAVEIEDDSVFVVAKVGEGYKWMVDKGLPEVCDIIEEHTEYNKWVLITNLGVNDLHNKQKYVDAYEELSELFEIYFVSVNPCKGSYDYLNSKIDDFNKTMSDLEFVTYIDTCTLLRKDGFSSSDGLHYSKSTYQKIYNIIIDNVKDED